MENEEEYWEQPQDLVLDTEQQAEVENEIGGSQKELLQEEEAKTSEAEKGVPVGKFKSVEALYDAYNNLQKEFTKKCQRLAEAEKDKTCDEENDETLELKFRQFLSSNGEASEYSEEIKRRLSENQNLKNLDDPYSYIWAEMLFEKLKSPSEDGSLISNYILNNDKIKDVVITNYINQLSENKSPVKISSSSGTRVAASVALTPESLADAKKMALDLFS